MKNVPVILAVCMLLFSSLDVHGTPHGNGPAACCFHYRTSRLPKKNVVRVQETSRHCTMVGVVFTMKEGVKQCVNPNQSWVKEIIAMHKDH